jgi:hypothetical protein
VIEDDGGKDDSLIEGVYAGFNTGLAFLRLTFEHSSWTETFLTGMSQSSRRTSYLFSFSHLEYRLATTSLKWYLRLFSFMSVVTIQ